MALVPGGSFPASIVPAQNRVTVQDNYIDFQAAGFNQWAQQYLPELYEQEVERYGNRTLSGFLRMVGAEMPMTSDQVIWSEQNRLHIAYQTTTVTAGAYPVIQVDILQITNPRVVSAEKYTGTSLSNAQMIIAKSSMVHKGTTSIQSDTVNWGETGASIDTIVGPDMCYYIGGGDSMGHTMKGNLALFISGGESITGTNINISGIKNNGNDVGTEVVIPNIIQPEIRSKLGASSVDILLTVCTNVSFTNTVNNLTQPTTENAGVNTIVDKTAYINDCTNINIS